MEELLTKQEVAAWLRMSPQSLVKWAQVGRIPAVKVGKSWLFRRSQLESWSNAGFGKQG